MNRLKRRLLLVILILQWISIQNTSAQCAATEGPGVQPDELIRRRVTTSGSRYTDSVVQAYYTLLAQKYQLVCTVFFLKDEANSFATKSANDHNIYLGIPLLNAVAARPHGNAMIAYLIAHEMGHLYQYKDPHNRFFDDRINTNSFELQADYLAGNTLCKAGIITPDFYQDLYRTVESLGDFSFYKVTHHGSPQQRSNAVDMGIRTCNLTYLSNVYDNSFYYINPVSLIKPFNDKQIIGEFYLYDTGRKKFPGHDRIYYNENGELFFMGNDDTYIKIGVGHMLADTYSTYTFEIPYNNTVVHCKKTDMGKFLDEDGTKLGEFIFYAGFVMHGAPMTLTLHQSTPVTLTETSNFAPSIALDNNTIYLAFANQENNVAVASSDDGTNFAVRVVLPFKIDNAPSIAVFNGIVFVSWLDSLRRPVCTRLDNQGNWSYNEVWLNNETGADKINMAVFNQQLFFAWRSLSGNINIMSTKNGNSFRKEAVLSEKTARPPCIFVWNDNLCVGGVDLQTGQAYEIQSYNGSEFFNKQFLPYIDMNNTFQVSVHPVPELMLVEQWFVFHSNTTQNITFTNQFSEINSVNMGERAIDVACVAFPYFAWTEDSGQHHIKIARLLQGN